MDAQDDARTALIPVMQPGEQIVRTASAVGCTLVLTDMRLFLVRDGVNFRPRTGVQHWELDRSLNVRMTPIKRNTGRLVVEGDGRVASVFITTVHEADVEALVADIRRHIYSNGEPEAAEAG